MASNRQFGTELSVNLTSSSPRSPLKRSATSYTDGQGIDNRPGKKPRTLTDWSLHFQDRTYNVPLQRKRVEISRSRRVKVEVILFLECHRVLKTKVLPKPPKKYGPKARAEYQHRLAQWEKDEYVPPTLQQAATWFLIPLSTINDWWKQKDDILKSQYGSRMMRKTWVCYWPEMESRLFELFCERRDGGYIVRRWWFQKMALKLFRQFYVEPLRANGKVNEAADMDSLFVCSNGRFEGFCRRNRIALRRLTRIVRNCILNRESVLIY